MLVGGADEGEETSRVFSYMNLARAFAELQSERTYCLHKNRWWQTSRGPLLDSGAFVAGLEYAAGVEAVVLGKPSPSTSRRRSRRSRPSRSSRGSSATTSRPTSPEVSGSA